MLQRFGTPSRVFRTLIFLGVLLLLVIVFVVVNLLTDLVYGLLDPRIRLVGASR